MGRYDEAIQPLKDAIRLDPQSSDALYTTAAAYARLGDKRNALQQLKQAIHVHPALASEAAGDHDFRSLRSDPDFLAITRQ